MTRTVRRILVAVGRRWLRPEMAAAATRWTAALVLATLIVFHVLQSDGDARQLNEVQTAKHSNDPPQKPIILESMMKTAKKSDSAEKQEKKKARTSGEKKSLTSGKNIFVDKKPKKKINDNGKSDGNKQQQQGMVDGAVGFLDSLVKSAGSKNVNEQYDFIKSMLLWWNPKASSWAKDAKER